jgi:Tol biopolymer transport system component/DNA-binding winged helix-turn-helix (wHTH) protein
VLVERSVPVRRTAAPSPVAICRFGIFEVNLGSRQILKVGREVHLQEQPLRLLLLLLERPGELFTREELQKRLWPNDTFVEFDDGLNTAIQKIRQGLGDEARNPRFIETVPRQGYRFIAPVQISREHDSSPAVHETSPAVDAGETPPLPWIRAEGPEPGLPDAGPAAVRPRFRGHARWIPVVAISAIALGWILLRPQTHAVGPLMRLRITPPAGVELRPGIRGGSAISPDGKSIIFSGGRDGKVQLWMRRLDSLESRPLPGSEDGRLPFWSPDGRSIGFQAGGKIRKIDIAGGPPLDLAVASRPTRGAWTESGEILFATGTGGPILRVNAAGGATTQATPAAAGALWPYPIPKLNRFLYFDKTRRILRLSSVTDPSAPAASLFAAETGGLFAPPFGGFAGQLLWLKDSTLMAQAFDPAAGRLSGEAVAVAEGVGVVDRSRLLDATVSANGMLLYGPGNTAQSRLAWIRRDGTVAEYVSGQEWVTAFRLSSNGQLALIEQGIPRALWMFDFGRSLLTRASFEQEWTGWPAWSPDGLELAYSSEQSGRMRLFVRNAKSGRTAMALPGNNYDDFLYDWSRDGRYLIYCEVNPETKLDLWVLPLTGERKPRPFLRNHFNEDWPQFSPDGRWVAYVSDESGRNEVYVTSFPDAERKWQVSTEGGSMPRWPNSGELFYESASGHIVAVQTRPGRRQFEWTSTRRLFANPMPGQVYDIAPKGDRLLMMTPVDGRRSNELTVIVNWQAALPHL